MMLQLALRNLLHGRIRTLLTCTAIGAVIALLLVLEGFEQGLRTQLRRMALSSGGDLLLVQAGLSNMIGARSVLPQMSREQAESVPGVKAAHPLTGIPVIYDSKGRKTPVFLRVFDTHGGPARIIAGGPIVKERQIIIDESLSRRYGLRPGDTLLISGFRFEVAGISAGTAAMFTPFAFINYDSLIDFYLEADLAADISAFPLLSFLAVEVAPGEDPSRVARALEKAVPSADVFPTETIAQNDAKVGASLFGSVLWLLKTIGYLMGLIVVAMLMLSAVGSRMRELGVLKAIGFGNAPMTGLVMIEALLVASLAIPLGAIAAGLIAWSIHAAEPLYLILPYEIVPSLRTFAACAGFAVAGALLPAHWCARLEPTMVFNS